jgi:hypothetical protein
MRTLLECPVDGCEWTMDPDAGAGPVQYTVRTDLPWNEAVSAAVAEVALRRAAEVERLVREHAESHDVLDYLRTIRRLEQDLAQQGSGIRPHMH